MDRTIETSFEHSIRNAHVWAEAKAWADAFGIYRIRITGAFLDGVNVIGLLTDADIMELESESLRAFANDAANRAGE